MHHVVCVIDGFGFTVDDETMAVNAQRDGKRVLESREILIELSEQPELIGEFA